MKLKENAMSHKIITFCDVCNKSQTMNSSGRGYVEANEESAMKDFDWIQTKDGIMCIDCQKEQDRYE